MAARSARCWGVSQVNLQRFERTHGNRSRRIRLCPLPLETKLLSQESFDVWSAGQPQRDVATLVPKGDLEVQKRAAARLEVHPLGDFDNAEGKPLGVGRKTREIERQRVARWQLRGLRDGAAQLLGETLVSLSLGGAQGLEAADERLSGGSGCRDASREHEGNGHTQQIHATSFGDQP